jgi:short-subunit dehydrogenase
MRTIRGKKALVTGAASGIGRAIALELARHGADLFLLDVDMDGLSAVAAAARELGAVVCIARCDLTQPAEISRAARQAVLELGAVDILVNNAGVAYYGPTDRMTAAQWDWLLGINLLAPIQLTRELLPTLLARLEPSILNVCSIAGLVAGGRFAAYHTSKFGLVGFTEALRAEYGRRGIGVTALCPGPVRTNLYASAQSGKKSGTAPEPPAWICTTPERVARAAVRAIRRNRRLVLLTPLAHLLWNVKRFAPWFLDFLNHFSLKRNRRGIVTDPVAQDAARKKDAA